MISLSLGKSPVASKDSPSGASAPMPQPLAESASALLKATAATPASPLPALTKAEMREAAKGPSHGRKFGLSWLQLGRVKKRLQTLETVSLGEKRFIALVRVDDRQFLIGGAPSSVGLLTELAQEESFHQVLNDATQGLNVALNVKAPEPVASAPAAEATPDPLYELNEAEPPTASVKISPAALKASRDVPNEIPVYPPRPVDEAFMQAYREVASAAAAAAVLPVPSAAEPEVSLGPKLPAMQAPVQSELIPPQTPASPALSSAPAFTFQNWPASTQTERLKPEPKVSLKPASAPLSGFTWSLTGAAS